VIPRSHYPARRTNVMTRPGRLLPSVEWKLAAVADVQHVDQCQPAAALHYENESEKFVTRGPARDRLWSRGKASAESAQPSIGAIPSTTMVRSRRF
jgi:hypothetical protein